MDKLQLNNFTYNFNDGQVTSAQIGLYGNEAATGEYINASIRVNKDDLPAGKTFMQVAMADMVTIARQKLAKDTAIKEATVKTDNGADNQ